MAHQPNAAYEEVISHDEDGYLVANLEVAKGRFEQHRLHELVCASFHGPKPTETSVAIIIERDPPYRAQCRLGSRKTQSTLTDSAINDCRCRPSTFCADSGIHSDLLTNDLAAAMRED
jgi:hypothetical protein